VLPRRQSSRIPCPAPDGSAGHVRKANKRRGLRRLTASQSGLDRILRLSPIAIDEDIGGQRNLAAPEPNGYGKISKRDGEPGFEIEIDLNRRDDSFCCATVSIRTRSDRGAVHRRREPQSPRQQRNNSVAVRPARRTRSPSRPSWRSVDSRVTMTGLRRAGASS